VTTTFSSACWQLPSRAGLTQNADRQFPPQSTTKVVDLDFFENLVSFAKEHRLMIVHDLAMPTLYLTDIRPPAFFK